MANTGYGLEYYGRSNYGALNYHEVQAVANATASASAIPTLAFTILNQPINAVSTLNSNINHIFQNQNVNIDSVATGNITAQRVNLANPFPIIQNSGHLIHGTQVDLPETFILLTTTLNASGTQIDVGSTNNINAVATTNVVGTQVDLAVSNITASSTINVVGTQVDLAVSNITASSSVNAIGTQIDVPYSILSSTSNVTTINPIFGATFNLKEDLNQLSLAEVNGNTVDIGANKNVEINISDASLSGDVIGLSNVPQGRYNTSQTHLSFKTDTNGNTYLQVSGSANVVTGGGQATNQLRTLYQNTADTSETPSYTGTAHPYIYVLNAVTFDEDVSAVISYKIVSGFNILLLDGKPVYQSSLDTNDETASGISVANFNPITKTGAIQSVSKTSTSSDSLLISGAGITKTGTEGTSGAKLSFNKSTSSNLSLYKYNQNISAISLNISSSLSSVESVSLLTSDSLISSISTLDVSAIRKYFLETHIASASSVSSEASIKWTDIIVPDEAWTEQKIAQ